MSSDASFGQIVKERRIALDLTQIELAHRVGCAPITIRRIEAGNLRPSFQMAELLALSLKIPDAQQLDFVRLARQKKAKTPIPKPTPSPGEIGMSDLTGRAVKGFLLGELIGSGGFGVVYQAIQPSVQRDVAVKIILPRFANQPTFIRRFETEAQLVARLEHPHIVPLYDYWREPDAAYLIMRLLRGGSLEDQITSGPMPMADFKRLVPQLCMALDTAHRHGVIHRDIKPANVMLDEDKNAYLTDFGIAKNLSTSEESQLTQGGVLVGSPAYISPEQILAEPIQAQSDIYCLGIMLYEILVGQKPFPGPTPVAYLQQHLNDPLPPLHEVLPELPPAIDDVIQKATAKKSEDRYQSTLALLADLERGWQTAVSTTTPPIHKMVTPDLSTQEITALENPYRGLRAFTEADAGNFYGRKALVQDLQSMMADGSDLSRFVAVIGPSGSGKSSVVKAGLIPALRRGGLPDSDSWFIVDLTPGSHPWEEVEAALLRVAVNPPDSLLSQLRDGPRGLHRAIHRILPNDDETELVMVIDQFEELFTLVEDEQIRSHFLEGLVTAVLDPKSRLRLIITLRADFTDRPLQYVDFGEMMRQRTTFVLPLTPNELTDAITRPITQLGMEMEPALVSTIIREVGDQPGILPLMQYGLTELFENRQGRTLTLANYQSTGGVLGALARRADEIYNNLDNAAQAATRQLFLRLITLGEGVEDTRRRVLVSELMSIAGVENNNQQSTNNNQQLTLDAYGRFHLLTFDHDPVTRAATVEVAHEALLREWPRLRNWLSDSREDVRRQRLLADAATQWQSANQEASYLLRGSRLIAFESWRETTNVALTTGEQSYLTSSIAARDQRHAEEEARRQRELETAHQLAEEQAQRAEEQTTAAQNSRQRALILAGVSVLAIILAIAAFGFARSSTNNANLAATREVEAFANLILASTSEADAIRNANLATTREAEAEAERETALTAQQQAEEETNFRATAEAIAINERQIAEQQQAIAEQQLRLTTSRELALAANANLEFDPERSLLLGLAALESAYTTEAEEEVRAALQASRVEFTLTEEGENILGLDYFPNRDGLMGIGLANNGKQSIVIWDIKSGDRLETIPLEDIVPPEFINENFMGMEISPDSSLLVIASNNLIKILEINSWETIHTLEGHTDVVGSITFSPDGTLLASGGDDGVLIIWDIKTGDVQMSVLATQEGAFGGIVDDVKFSPDGSRVATAGDDNYARVWDIETGEEIVRMLGDGRWVDNIAFSLDGNRLLTLPGGADRGGAVLIWDITTTNNSELTEPQAEWSTHDALTWRLQFSPNGRNFATISADGTLKLWEEDNDSAVEILTLSGHSGSVDDMAFSPDSLRVITLSGGEARVWDISEAGGGEILNIADNSTPVALHSETNTLVTATSQGLIKIWDAVSGSLRGSFDIQVESLFWSVTGVSPDGRYIAKGGNDGSVHVWDLTTQQELYTRTASGPGIIGGVFSGIIHVVFSPDSSQFATAGADGFVKLWDVESGEIISEWIADSRLSFWSEEELPTGVTHIRFSPDGRYLAAASDPPKDEAARIKIWDLNSNSELTVIENIESRVWSFAISPNSRLIASTVGNGVKIWEITTGNEVAFIEGTLRDANFFSADGNQLIGIGDKILIYDLETEEAQISFPPGRSFTLSSNSQQLAKLSNEGIITIYTLDFDSLLEIAQSRVTRSLTEAECKEYLHVDTCPTN